MNSFNRLGRSQRHHQLARTFCTVAASAIFSLTTIVWAQPASQYYLHPAVDGQYFLRVRAIDNQGIEGTDAASAFRLKARPEPPFTSAPPNNAKFAGEKADFSWATSTGATSYRFQFARDATFATLIADEKSYKGINLASTTTLSPGQYFWRVASIRPDGDNGPFGDVQSFTLKPIPAAQNPPKEEGGRVSFS